MDGSLLARDCGVRRRLKPLERERVNGLSGRAVADVERGVKQAFQGESGSNFGTRPLVVVVPEP